jgi:NNP family nitrate/nitrite transporter-like MFS transporter
MNLRDFRRAGHWPTLLCAFLYFDISFMVWVLVGAVANSVAPEFGLSDWQRGLLVGVPLLGGAVLRIVLGLLTDHIGARRTGLIGMLLTVAPLLLGWLWADSFEQMLVVGLLLGVAGASFAVALPLASRWYPPRYQGLALGIAGAGNSGTALATLFAPRVAESFGWHMVFAVALIPLAGVLVLFALFAKDSPEQPAPKRLADYAGTLKQADAWWFCLFYAVTFGGFVGLASFLNIYFHTQHGLSKVTAGVFATACVIAGSFLRPVGGYLADRVGGVSLLMMLYIGIGLLMLDLSTSPPLAWGTVVIVTVMGLLGLGNGAVFQLVPQRFPREVGVITGVVGAAGGVGGFFLPTLLGAVREFTGSYGLGFAAFALLAVVCAVCVVRVAAAWEGVFIARGGVAVTQESSTEASTA